MKVPAFLLRRLYVRGSLRNTAGGWGFTLRNTIAGGEAIGLDPLVLDGTVIAAEHTYFHMGDEAISFNRVDPEHRFGLSTGRDIDITVDGTPLSPGSHTVTIAFAVPGIGRLSFDFTDVVS